MLLAQSFRSCFSFFIFASQMKDDDPFIWLFQESDTTCRKSSWWIQSGLNRKGIGPRSWSRANSRRMGLWLEVQWGRILEEAKRPSERKEEWTRNLSSRAATWLGPILLLVQVNFPLTGFISIRSHPRMMSSTHSLDGSLTGVPPFFSLAARVTFRSPAKMIFSKLCELRKDSNVFHHSFFLNAIRGHKGWTDLWYAQKVCGWALWKPNAAYLPQLQGHTELSPKRWRCLQKHLWSWCQS